MLTRAAAAAAAACGSSACLARMVHRAGSSKPAHEHRASQRREGIGMGARAAPARRARKGVPHLRQRLAWPCLPHRRKVRRPPRHQPGAHPPDPWPGDPPVRP
eukprot:scaffold3762_cov118-Isochrysis_galbana.AAC.6